MKLIDRIFNGLFLILTVILLLTAVIVIIGGFTVSILSESMDHDEIIIKTECYDERGNEINELTCDKNIKCNYRWKGLNYIECKDLFAFSGDDEK